MREDQERFLVGFSKRLNTALGTDETGIWDGQCHTGLAYRQWHTAHGKGSRILIPFTTWIKDGDDFDNMAVGFYAASDGEVFGLSDVEVFIEGRWYVRTVKGKRQIVNLEKSKNLFLCEPSRNRWLA